MRKIIGVGLMFLLFSGATCVPRVRLDSSIDAVKAGDYTAPVEGCGNQLVSGYTYCRVLEGDVADQTLTFVAPTSQCLGTDPCVSLKLYFPDGSPSLGLFFPKGSDSITVSWKDILKKSTFDTGDRGFWPFTITLHAVDLTGKDHLTIFEGEVRLRVISKGYVALNAVQDDDNFVWKWVHDGVLVEATTAGRVYIGPSPVPSVAVLVSP